MCFTLQGLWAASRIEIPTVAAGTDLTFSVASRQSKIGNPQSFWFTGLTPEVGQA